MRQVILGTAGLSCVLLACVDHLSGVQPAWRPLAADEAAQCRAGQVCYTYNLPTDCPANCIQQAGPCGAIACNPNVGCPVAGVANSHNTQYYSSCLAADSGSLLCGRVGSYCNTGMSCLAACLRDQNNNWFCQNNATFPCANTPASFTPQGGTCSIYGRTRQATTSPVAVINGAGFNVFDDSLDDR